MSDWPWDELGIDETDDVGAIKRAYATKLKAIDRERDLVGFQALRSAYNEAIAYARPIERATDKLHNANQREEPFESHVEGTCDNEPAGPNSLADAFGSGRGNLARMDVAESIIEMLKKAHSRDEVRRALDRVPELDHLASIEPIGAALARMLIGSEFLPWTTLQVLSERFGWMDIQRIRIFEPEFRHSMARWLRARELAALVHGGELSSPGQQHLEKLRHYLRPPYGFWRAFRIGANLPVDLNVALAALQQELKDDWRLVISEPMHDFLLATTLRQFSIRQFGAFLAGRVVAVYACAFVVAGILLLLPGGNAPIGAANLALANVLALSTLIHAVQVKLLSLDPKNSFSDAFVYSLPVTILATLQLYGVYIRSFQNYTEGLQ